MEITECKTADIVTLSLSGKLDTTTAKAFEEKILARLNRVSAASSSILRSSTILAARACACSSLQPSVSIP